MPRPSCPRSAERIGEQSDGRSGPRARLGADLVPGNQPGRLVLAELGDPPSMALLAGEWLGDEDVNEVLRLVNRMLAGTDRDEVRVVVLPREQSSALAPHESR